MKIHSDISTIAGIKKPILTIGTFDGVHLGHRAIISRLNEIAKEEKGESVLLTFHPHPRSVVSKSGEIELLTTMEERLKLLDKAGLDHVVIQPFTMEFSRISALSYVRDLLVNTIGVHYAVVGYDHHFGRNREGDILLFKELAELYGFKVEEIPAQTIDEVNVSSTKVRAALKEGNVDQVKSYLGYDYKLKGTVVRGDGRGTGLGFPTANILPDDPDKLIPAKGVYAVTVEIDGNTHKAMLNIGLRPTFNKLVGDTLHLEAHVLDFEQDLYGKQLVLDFKKFIREEVRFNSKEELVKQLHADREKTIALLA